MSHVHAVKKKFTVSDNMDRFCICCITGEFWTNIWKGVFRPVSIFKGFERKDIQLAKHTGMATEETSNRFLNKCPNKHILKHIICHTHDAVFLKPRTSILICHSCLSHCYRNKCC